MRSRNGGSAEVAQPGKAKLNGAHEKNGGASVYGCGISYAQYPEGAADDGKHAESVLGILLRLLEPSGRGSLRGRGRGSVWRGCGFTRHRVQQ